MTAPIAHAGHWYHTILYVAPVILIAFGLWWSGRQTGEERPPRRAADQDGD
jgi:hypothetical protein